jgi:hypothetical protein
VVVQEHALRATLLQRDHLEPGQVRPYVRDEQRVQVLLDVQPEQALPVRADDVTAEHLVTPIAVEVGDSRAVMGKGKEVVARPQRRCRPAVPQHLVQSVGREEPAHPVPGCIGRLEEQIPIAPAAEVRHNQVLPALGLGRRRRQTHRCSLDARRAVHHGERAAFDEEQDLGRAVAVDIGRLHAGGVQARQPFPLRFAGDLDVDHRRAPDAAAASSRLLP